MYSPFEGYGVFTTMCNSTKTRAHRTIVFENLPSTKSIGMKLMAISIGEAPRVMF